MLNFSKIIYQHLVKKRKKNLFSFSSEFTFIPLNCKDYYYIGSKFPAVREIYIYYKDRRQGPHGVSWTPGMMSLSYILLAALYMCSRYIFQFQIKKDLISLQNGKKKNAQRSFTPVRWWGKEAIIDGVRWHFSFFKYHIFFYKSRLAKLIL